MPQHHQKNNNKNNSKKKKGRAPAHQNQFAFRHNPKSKLTAKILDSPNHHVCRRCHEKVEWRKRYRKYKPRTQPGKCNLCQRRNVVMAAYHTICESCTRSDKARAFMRSKQEGEEEPHFETPTREDDEVGVEAASSVFDEGKKDDLVTGSEALVGGASGRLPGSGSDSRTDAAIPTDNSVYRVCAICVREVALPDEDDKRETTVDDILSKESRRISLRERKRVERQLERERKQAAEAKQAAKEARREERRKANASIEQGDSDDDSDQGSYEDEDQSGHEADANDPFLHAVGGKDNLLVGDAYRERLLKQES